MGRFISTTPLCILLRFLLLLFLIFLIFLTRHTIPVNSLRLSTNDQSSVNRRRPDRTACQASMCQLGIPPRTHHGGGAEQAAHGRDLQEGSIHGIQLRPSHLAACCFSPPMTPWRPSLFDSRLRASAYKNPSPESNPTTLPSLMSPSIKLIRQWYPALVTTTSWLY
ncbi:hypothetical protein SLA2020_110280 [Shorea laevis]